MTKKEEIAFLKGQYNAIGWVLTSPRINGEIRDRIHEKGMEILTKLKERGVEFK